MNKIIAMALMLSLCLFFSCVKAEEKDSGKDVKTEKAEKPEAKPTPKTLNPPVGSKEQKAEAEERLPFETDWGATSRKMGNKKMGVAQGDLGSKTNPVRCAGPSGERAYLDRLRWKDGKSVTYERAGNVGVGLYGHILDLYKVTCEDGSVHEVYMDMYYTKLVDNQPLPGFKLAKEDPVPEGEEKKKEAEAETEAEISGADIWIGLCQPTKDNKLYGLSLSKSKGVLIGLFLEVVVDEEQEKPTMKVYPMKITPDGKKFKCEVFSKPDGKGDSFPMTITPEGKMEGDSFSVEIEVPSKGIKEKIELAKPAITSEEGEEGEGEEGNEGGSEGEGGGDDPKQKPALPDDDPKKKELKKSAPEDEGPDAE